MVDHLVYSSAAGAGRNTGVPQFEAKARIEEHIGQTGVSFSYPLFEFLRDGSHVFSATLDQHNAAVAQYLARQRQRAASESAR